MEYEGRATTGTKVVSLATERAKGPPHFWVESPEQDCVQPLDVVAAAERVALHQHSLPYSVPEMR